MLKHGEEPIDACLYIARHHEGKYIKHRVHALHMSSWQRTRKIKALFPNGRLLFRELQKFAYE
jgi:hypothetical protein